MKKFKLIIIIILYIILFTTISYSENIVIIKKGKDNTWILKNYSKTNLLIGQKLYTYKIYKYTGTIQIIAFKDNNYILCKSIENKGISIGDNIKLKKESEFNYKPIKSRFEESKEKNNFNYNYKFSDPRKAYQKILKKNSKVVFFAKKYARSPVNIKYKNHTYIDPYSAYNLYELYQNYQFTNQLSKSYGEYGSQYLGYSKSFALANLLLGLYGLFNKKTYPQNNIKQKTKQIKYGKSFIRLTLINENLLKAKVAYYAYKEVIKDPVKLQVYKNKLIEKYQLKDYIVFNVSIRNNGYKPFSLKPLLWHIYLITPDNNRYKLAKYTLQLDKTIAPQNEVNGFLYFLKKDINNFNYFYIQLEDFIDIYTKKLKFALN